MTERWCPEDEVTYSGDQCPSCGYIDPMDDEDEWDDTNRAGGHEHWDVA